MTEVIGAVPVYDYRCDGCGYTFEVMHGFDERPEVRCGKCGQTARKLFRPVPIIFKGSGWHVTDYGKGSTPSKSTREKTEIAGEKNGGKSDED